MRKDQTPDQQLTAAKTELRNLQVMARRPRQSADKLELLVNLQRSAKAEIKLLEKYVDWASSGATTRRRLIRTDGHI